MARKKNVKAEVSNHEETTFEESNVMVATAEVDAEISEMDENPDSSEELSHELDGIESDASVFLSEEEETEGFLPEVSEDEVEELEASEADDVSLEGTELDGFDSAEIEEVEFVEEERLESIVESVLFASDRPVSLASLKLLFKGTNIRGDKIRRALDQLAVEYAGGRRGVTLEEVPGGYQLRTKIDNMEFLKRTLKTRQFKLSGPALEVLSIVAYKQPTVKAEVDEIRGVESGHLLRALMEKNLVTFEGKSELPGRPMQYGTTKKFLEIFGLRSLKELPTLSQIDELLPEGIDEQQAEEKPTLSSITDSLSENTGSVSYSSGEDELMKIQEQLEEISTSSDFFAEEKRRQAEKRDLERAQNIREALAMGEPVSTRDENWLKKFDEAIAAGTTLVAIKEGEMAAKRAAFMNKSSGNESGENSNEESMEASDDGGDVAGDQALEEDSEENELTDAIEAFDNDEDMHLASDDQLFADGEEEDSDDELPFLGEADDIDEEEGKSSI
ncbi:SMC-Scp complex subunit ScpB [Bdellovibrio svalbardensis]|uniref:SMC-Scp complex subunit ScpB n=1 Tax=Bdellovibrio svalbardensis TaxID=2972972 RepID=A0ABT6DIF0_9BACT|nr:SMC-Scp complex subunit ScpB [Bdellovibrio svalbardensis]MDG0816626.1 SMC-Scp complex subunit ScpB [Bdellovibrio svalbardensis]